MADNNSKHSQLSSHSIFLAKNLATNHLGLSSVISIPTNLTDPHAIILYCGLEAKLIQNVQEMINFEKLTQNSISENSKNEEKILKNFKNDDFLCVVFNLPILHAFISQNGENSVSGLVREFYLTNIKFLNVKPAILSKEEKERNESIHKAWNFPNVSEGSISSKTSLTRKDSGPEFKNSSQKDLHQIFCTENCSITTSRNDYNA